MATQRLRSRYTGVDGKVNSDYSRWNDPIVLGSYSDKLIVYRFGVPFDEGWGQPYSPQSYRPEVTVCNGEWTWDELHPRARRTAAERFATRNDPKRMPWYLTGGPFLSIKIDNGLPVGGRLEEGVYENVTRTKRYVGGFMPPPNSMWGTGWGNLTQYVSFSNAFLPDVSAYFDRAWRKTKPKLEFASLFTFLREIGEVVPMLRTTASIFGAEWKSAVKTEYYKSVDTDYGSQIVKLTRGSSLQSRNMKPREIAEQFLNHQFGWVPFLGDLESFFTTYLDAEALIKKISDENGKWVRKSAKVEKTENTRLIADVQFPFNGIGYTIPCMPAGMTADFFTAPPSYKIYETERLSVRASGKFRFYRPEFDITLPDYSSAWRQAMRYVKIYGAEVSPWHVWQSVPWTWALDWVSNLGNYVERLSDTLEDQVAAAYFFITAKKHIERRIEISLPFGSGLKTLVFKKSFTSTQRVSADSPYGFNLTWENLSPRRLAILSALGITRRR